MFSLPRGRTLPGNANELHQLPSAGLQQCKEPQSRNTRLPADVFPMSLNYNVVERQVRSQHYDVVSTRRRSRFRSLLAVSHQRPVCGHTQRLRLMPYWDL